MSRIAYKLGRVRSVDETEEDRRALRGVQLVHPTRLERVRLWFKRTFYLGL